MEKGAFRQDPFDMPFDIDPVTGALYSFFQNFEIECQNFEKRSTAPQLLGLLSVGLLL